MARKSKYDRPVQELTPENMRYTVAVYLRLSVEDGDSVESNSIGNQRKMCLAYLSDHDDLVFGKIYVDDGHTGMDYKRPGFQAMLADLRAKKVNCIVVKDISRLGRHYIMTSEYVERIFPEMEVRLICINDAYDSEDNQSDRESLLMPFKLMMNETYVKDTARRIRSSIHAKMSSGDFLPSSGSVPYGYRRDPKNGTFEIDAETAFVVQHIFELRAHGGSFSDIAKRLNADGIPSPGRIRFERGLTDCEKFRNAIWIRGTVRKITQDNVYLGVRTHGKVCRARLGGQKKKQPKETWQTIPNAHPAIITEELFDEVQEVNLVELQRRATFQKRDDPSQDFRSIFRGKVFCGNCGARMSGGRTESRLTSPVSVHFECNQYLYSNRQQCSCHYIRQEVLMEKLRHLLDKQVEVAVDVERLIEAAHEMKRTPDGVRNRLASIHGQYVNMDAKLERLLEDAAAGILDREEYMRMKRHYQEEQASLAKQEQAVREEYEQLQTVMGTAETWLNEIQRYRRVPVVDRQLVDALVDRILVYENRDIHISLTYSDPFALLTACLDESMGGVSRAG